MTTTSAAPSVATTSRTGSVVRVAAWTAAVVGSLFAAVSAYWALGGTWLLDTVGGGLESAGRSGSGAVLVLVWAAVAAKLAAVVLPLLAVSTTVRHRRARTVRRLAWVEAVVLTGYGAVLTGVGLLAQLGVIATDAGADHRALAWHAFLWDPWFLVWGLLVVVAMSTRRSSRG